jgi:hypothetical protein
LPLSVDHCPPWFRADIQAIEALGFGARLYSNTWEFDVSDFLAKQSYKADEKGMGFLVGMALIQLATVLLTAGLYKVGSARLMLCTS